MDNQADLRALVASRHPLLLVEMRDEHRFLSLLREVAGSLDLVVWTWSAVSGLSRDGQGAQYATREPQRALDFAGEVEAPSVFVFVDVHPALEDAVFVRKIKEFALAGAEGRTLILTGPRLKPPPEFEGLGLPWVLEPPTSDEIEELVRRTMSDLAERDMSVDLGEDDVAALVESLRGLSVTEAEHLIQRAAIRDEALTSDDVAFVRREKAGLLEAAGALELIEADVGTLDDVGGMDGLKGWLALRGRSMEPEAADFGLDPPRGVLIAGVPGCGKSLVAKTLARTWSMPLVLLDPARLYAAYVGESEQRLADALRTVEAMSPAVLWVDEIEKGFASGGKGDSGVSKRVLGTFLRWMQDRPSGVFVVATSNDVPALPPEFLRKGRFDEVFFVDLPSGAERAEIFRLHISRRGRDAGSFDLDPLVDASDGFSGAEIEPAVVGALYRAYAAGGDLTADVIHEELSATVPLSRSRAEDIDALRAWSRGRAVPSSS